MRAGFYRIDIAAEAFLPAFFTLVADGKIHVAMTARLLQKQILHLFSGR